MKKLSQVVCMIVATLITCTMLSACASENDIRKNGYDEGYSEGYQKGYIPAKQDAINWLERYDLNLDTDEYFQEAVMDKDETALSVEFTGDDVVTQGNWNAWQDFLRKRMIDSMVENVTDEDVNESNGYDIKAKYRP